MLERKAKKSRLRRKFKGGKEARIKEWQDAEMYNDVSKANKKRGPVFETEALTMPRCGRPGKGSFRSRRRGWT